MDITLPFGDTFITAQVPDRTRVITSSWMPEKLRPVEDLPAEVRRALGSPVDFPRITDVVGRGKKVTIAFDDPTVPCFAPLRQTVIGTIVDDLVGAGVEKRDITLMCAPGLHRRWTRNEIANIIGSDLVEQFGYRVMCHDAEDTDNLVYLGTTKNGYDVEVNRCVTDSDLTVYVNASTLRGLTGGWKSICVGLGTFRSIRWHHSPDGLSASVHDNRMHYILNEMGAFLEEKVGRRRVFKIETVLTSPFEVHRIFAGGVDAVRKDVLGLLTKAAPPRPAESEKVDVVLYGVPAYSPYATFARMNPILTLFSTGLGYFGGTIEKMGKKGCTVIMATPCPDDWDEIHHAAYREVWDRVLSRTRDPWEMRDLFEEDFAHRPEYIYKYRFCYSFHPVHGLMASYPLRRMKHIGRVIVAGAASPDLIRHVGCEPAESVEKAVSMAEAIHGKDCSIALIRHLPA